MREMGATAMLPVQIRRRSQSGIALAGLVTAGFIALLAALLPRPLWAAPLAQDLPRFEPGECMFDPFFPWTDYGPLICGYLVVPATRPGVSDNAGTPDDDTVRLAVVVLESTGESPRPDPLFVAQGGPGGSTIDTYLDLLAEHPLRNSRDIVLFDQRGTLYSEPALLCTEVFDAMPSLVSLPDDAATAAVLDLYAGCHARLTEEGVNLSAFNSLENAADVEDLRRALGYEAVNFYGVSYGTLLGLHLMRQAPDYLRSVILDGVVPTQTNFITEVPRSQDRVFGALFAACSADAQCAADYPDLESRFFALVERLNAEPVRVTVAEPETGREVEALLTGDMLVDFAFQLFYLTGGVGLLPKVIHDMEQGNYGFFAGFFPLLAFDRTLSDGMYYSVVCAEDADFQADAAPVAGLRPYFADRAIGDLQEYLDSCARWPVAPLPAAVDDPVYSTVPVLLLSGEFDPITPPAFAEIAAATLPNSYTYVLPGAGHGVALGVDACVDGIVADFLAFPVAEPDASCLAATPAPQFVAADAITIPFLVRLNQLEQRAWLHVAMAGLLLLGLLTAFVVWPVAYLVRAMQSAPPRLSPEQRRLRRLAQTLVYAFGVLAVSFVIALTGATVATALLDSNLGLLAALPASGVRIFILPLFLLVLLAGMVVVMLRMWMTGHDRPRSRIYYTFLTLCATGYVALLYVDGFLTVLF